MPHHQHRSAGPQQAPAQTPTSSDVEGAVSNSERAAEVSRATGDQGDGSVPRGGESYTIVRGDTLSGIARRVYGDASRWRDIRDANPDQCHRDGQLIFEGAVLQLPELQISVEEAPALDVDGMGQDDASDESVCLSRDYTAFFADLMMLDADDRQYALLQIRSQGEFSELLDALTEDDVAIVQGWLPPQEGVDGNYTLEERIDQALNTSRGTRALAAVDAIAASDIHTPARITERIRELLALGVALPREEGNDLQLEGVLSVNSAVRAAEAIVSMPAREYMGVLMQLQLVGSQSAMLQQFNLLKSLAARRDELMDPAGATAAFEETEGLADGMREMTEDEVLENTTVVQREAGGSTGMVQRYTMSCNVTSAAVVRAEADPVEALRLNQNGERAITELGGEIAGETEASLESHRGNVATARDTSAVTNAVNGAITALASSAPIDELTAVSDYLANRPFDNAKYQAGIAKIRQHLGQQGFPNDQAMRIVRETAGGGPTPGMDDTELATEWNGALGVDDVTGQIATSDFDNNLWALYTADNNGDGNADRLIPNPVPTNWQSGIRGLLDRARPRLESGEDVAFNVYWHGGGGHTMTFLDVRTDGGNRFLIHDTWTGTTAWVDQTDIMQATFPGISGNRGLLCGVIG